MDVFRKQLPMSAFVGIVAFTLLHVIGARYIYSYVPYKEWAVSLGVVEKGFFHDPRNHYDRLVHFFFWCVDVPLLRLSLSEMVKTAIVCSCCDGVDDDSNG